ncbi:hypothetical protein Hanom_Chr00s000005g01611101 [Helianthus anomalus]
MMRSRPYTYVDQWPGFVHSVRKYTSVHSRTPPYVFILPFHVFKPLFHAFILPFHLFIHLFHVFITQLRVFLSKNFSPCLNWMLTEN